MDRNTLDQLNNTLINPNGPGGKISAENHRVYNNALADYAENVGFEAARYSFRGDALPDTVPPAVGAWWYRTTTPGTYTGFISGGAPIEVTAADLDIEDGAASNEIILTVNDGAATKSVRRIRGPQGLPGADGKTSEPWEPKDYAAGSTVYHENNAYYTELGATAAEVPGASSTWVKVLATKETAEGTHLLDVTDAQGNILGYYDEKGYFHTLHADRAILNRNLQPEPALFFDRAEITDTTDFMTVKTDDEGNILHGIKKDGTFYARRIEAEEYAGNIAKPQSDEVPITDAKFLTFDFPDSVIDVDVYGTLPTDISDARASTDVVLTFRKGGQFLFKCAGVMAIQGQGSVGYVKKGYEVDFINSKGEALFIKFGKMHAVDAINFKAFHSDPTMTRDVSAGRLWHKIRTSRPFPSSFIADFTATVNTTNTKYLYFDDALFYAEGFPMRMTSNGQPFGLYVWRMKKKRENYRMDNGNLNNIFLDSANSALVLNFASFVPEQWDLKSPKVSGYEEAGPINNPTVMASINRVFNWVGASLNKPDAQFKAEAPTYFNMDSVIDYILACEAVCAIDSSGNNTEFMTWDGLRWSFCIYDQDNTAGFFNGFTGTTTLALRGDFWYKFKGAFAAEIKARYWELRNNGILSMNGIYDVYAEIPRTIPTDYYIENLSIWGWVGQAEGNTSLRHILNWFQGRLIFLDNLYT